MYRDRARQRRLIWPPEPGFFRMRLVRHGWAVPARIIHEELWQAVVDGVWFDPHEDPLAAPYVARIWQGAMKIDPDHYDWLENVRQWALAHYPDHPAAHPYAPVDPMLLRLVTTEEMRDAGFDAGRMVHRRED